MRNVNEQIQRYILQQLRQHSGSVSDLAEYLSMEETDVKGLLNGPAALNALELEKMAEYFGVSREALVAEAMQSENPDVEAHLIGQAGTEEARQAICTAFRLADMICFYSRAERNARRQMESWEP